MRLGITAFACVAQLLVASGTDYRGEVRYGGQAVPGATVTLSTARTKLVAATDAAGHYEFKGVASDGGPATLSKRKGEQPMSSKALAC